MSWQDDLRRIVIDGRRLIAASFRGVPFFVEESQRTGGRRTVTHEFPGRDDPWLDDLGRRARTFPVEAYVVGDDYVAQRNALLAVCEDQSGPGELLHPYHGKRVAICTDLAVRESSAEGRMARLSLVFSETPAQPAVPSTKPDRRDTVSARADDALVASRAELEAGYSVLGMPGYAIASATRTLTAMTDKLLEYLGPVASSSQELAKLASEIEIMTANAAALVRTPGDVIDSLGSAIDAVATSAAGAPVAMLQALSAAADLDFGPEPLGETATRERERENRRLLIAVIRRVLIIEAARLAPRGDYETIDYAIATRDQIAAQLETEAASASDTAYPALVQLRAEVLSSVPPEDLRARVVTLEQPTAIPSIVLSHRLYGTTDWEADILARNRQPHPGFLSGDLEVLSDGG